MTFCNLISVILLIHFDHSWYNLFFFDPFWAMLSLFGPFCSVSKSWWTTGCFSITASKAMKCGLNPSILCMQASFRVFSISINSYSGSFRVSKKAPVFSWMTFFFLVIFHFSPVLLESDCVGTIFRLTNRYILYFYIWDLQMECFP